MEDCQESAHIPHDLQRESPHVIQTFALLVPPLRHGEPLLAVPLAVEGTGLPEIVGSGHYELDEHISRARAPSKPLITPRQRTFIEELARENLMQWRILHALDRRFEFRPPALQTVQNIVNHYRRTRLGGNDKHQQVVEAVRRPEFSGREGEYDTFMFTNPSDEHGFPEVGNGSDARPFMVGISTKALLRNGVRKAGTSVLHLDATFKLNCIGYPC